MLKNRMLGSGNVQSEVRRLTEFNAVALNSSGETVVAPGKEQSITIEADDNLLPLIITEVRGNTLFIESQPNTNYQPTQPIRYRVTTTDLRRLALGGSGTIEAAGFPRMRAIDLSGSGDIAASDLATEAVEASLSGSGQIALIGSAARLDLSIDGSGDFHGESLPVEEAHVSINGSGSALLDVQEKLAVSINGSGSVRYSGDPDVRRSINGSGRIGRR